MVIVFETLPEHVQAKIARKMDFWDFREFEISSKQSMFICDVLKNRLILLDAALHLEQGLDFMTERAQGQSPKRWTMNVLFWPQNVVFSVFSIQIYNKSSLLSALHLVEEGNILCRNVSLRWFVDDSIPLNQFDRMLQTFDVSHLSFDSKTIDTRICFLPRFLELKSISFFMVVIPDEAFLQFRAHTLDICALNSHPHFGHTLNQFFKQWHSGNREIQKLVIQKDFESNSLAPETIFADIPHTVLWRKGKRRINTHLRLTEVDMRIQAAYLLQRDGHTLIVIEKHLQIMALEPEGDADEYVEKLLTGRIEFPIIQ